MQESTDASTARHEAPIAPLAGVRVLSCGSTIGGAYAGRLLADLGADVVTVEPPGGHALRRRGPFVGGDADADAQRGGCLLPGRHALRRGRRAGSLCWPPRTSSSAPDRPDLRTPTLDVAEAANPGLVVVDISTFGRTGPLADAPRRRPRRPRRERDAVGDLDEPGGRADDAGPPPRRADRGVRAPATR